jgi:hypothetical protein
MISPIAALHICDAENGRFSEDGAACRFASCITAEAGGDISDVAVGFAGPLEPPTNSKKKKRRAIIVAAAHPSLPGVHL